MTVKVIITFNKVTINSHVLLKICDLNSARATKTVKTKKNSIFLLKKAGAQKVFVYIAVCVIREWKKRLRHQQIA